MDGESPSNSGLELLDKSIVIRDITCKLDTIKWIVAHDRIWNRSAILNIKWYHY